MPVKKNVIQSHFLRKKTTAIFLALLLALLFSSNSHAHKVYIFAWTEGETVHTDSYYPNSKKVIGGTISVFNPEEEKLLEGKTDENGAFSFHIPQKTDLRIVLEASMGHRSAFLLKPGERSSGAKKYPESMPMVNKTTPDRQAPPIQVDADMLRKVLEEVLDVRLRPIYERLARMEKEKGPAPRDVIGGIGYILGLMGVVLYFKSRVKK